MGRTVIRSCAKLSYLHAQAFIDGHLDLSGTDLPPVEIAGGHSLEEVCQGGIGGLADASFIQILPLQPCSNLSKNPFIP